MEVLSGACDGHLHHFVADVMKSFDTVDRGILDCGPAGVPGWPRRFSLPTMPGFGFAVNLQLVNADEFGFSVLQERNHRMGTCR